MKISTDVLKRVERLEKSKRERVEAIADRHFKTCVKLGVPIESMDRVLIEAIEMINTGLDDGDEKWDEYTAPQRYHQYTAPTHGFGL